jgi:DNA repair exonuclease SbcCD ATPase subunit
MPAILPDDAANRHPAPPRETIRLLSERLREMARQVQPSPAPSRPNALEPEDLTRVLALVRHASESLRQSDERRRDAEERLSLISEQAAAELRDIDNRLRAAEARLAEADARAIAAEERAREADARADAAEQEAAQAKVWLTRLREAITDAFASDTTSMR